MKNNSRPLTVTIAATLQLLFAAVFVIAPIVLILYGADGEAAAGAEVVRQGFPADLLARHNIHFNESLLQLMLPFSITAAVVVIGVLNLAGKRSGRILSLICQPLILTAASAVIATQVFAAQVLEYTFRTSGDPALASLDARAIVDAVADAFPAWFYPYTTYARFALSTLGSLLVIVLLMTPSARTYFRKG